MPVKSVCTKSSRFKLVDQPKGQNQKPTQPYLPAPGLTSDLTEEFPNRKQLNNLRGFNIQSMLHSWSPTVSMCFMCFQH